MVNLLGEKGNGCCGSSISMESSLGIAYWKAYRLGVLLEMRRQVVNFPPALPDWWRQKLRVLSKRIHYGKFVAEAKFRASPVVYEAAIRAQDRAQLMDLLTYEKVEAAIKERVEMKAKTYGQEIGLNEEKSGGIPIYKIKPSLVARLYGEWIMPLTKEVQIEYLLRRLD